MSNSSHPIGTGTTTQTSLSLPAISGVGLSMAIPDIDVLLYPSLVTNLNTWSYISGQHSSIIERGNK